MSVASKGCTLSQTCDDAKELRRLQNPTAKDFYHYRKLQEHGEFRLLIVEPSSYPQDRIACSLIHWSTKGCQDYEALSYTWGTDKAVAPILIDGQVLLVRYNLFNALRTLRSCSKHRVLWVDALCINQADVAERNNQVSQMAEIYSNARVGLVWLGEADDHTDYGMNFLDEICTRAKSIRIKILKKASDRHRLYNEWYKLFHGVHIRQDADACLKGSWALFGRKWWTRTWTIQEIVLAKNIEVHVGGKSLPWEYFKLFSQLCTVYAVHTGDKNRQLCYYPPHFIRADTIRVLRLRRSENIKIPLSLMLEYTLSRFATDPRDKVFAVLGLVSCGPLVKPDYGINCIQVYIAATRAMLEYFGDLRIYNNFQDSHLDRQRELPSWVPDFMALTTGGLRTLTFIGGSSHDDFISGLAIGLLYRAASIKHDKLIRSYMKFLEGDSMLVLRGIPVDEVKFVSEVALDKVEFFSHEGLEEAQTLFKNVIMQWKSERGEKNHDYITGGSMQEAFWRTIALDCKVIDLHADVNLVNNPRNGERRLNSRDKAIPPQNTKSEEILIKALFNQAKLNESALQSRHFFTTEKGYIGIGPPVVKKGDVIGVLLGGEVPYVLRPSKEMTYKMMGQCYLHGIMDGEVVRGAMKGQFVYKDFAID